MTRVIVQVINESNYELPRYQTAGAAGMDIRATRSMTLHPKGRTMISSGLKVAIPEGYEIQIRPRSGPAYKAGITVTNSPGTIDSDYRDAIGVLLINHGDQPYEIQAGDRIAQMVLAKVPQISWQTVKELPITDRDGGLGSTGLK